MSNPTENQNPYLHNQVQQYLMNNQLRGIPVSHFDFREVGIGLRGFAESHINTVRQELLKCPGWTAARVDMIEFDFRRVRYSPPLNVLTERQMYSLTYTYSPRTSTIIFRSRDPKDQEIAKHAVAAVIEKG